MNTRIALLFLLAVLVLTVACNKTATPSTTAAPASAVTTAAAAPVLKDPCSLVTQEEVEKVLGKGATIKPGRVSNECTLDAADAIHGGLIVTVSPTRYWDSTKASLLSTNKGAKEYPGIGDDAFGLFGGITMKKGETTIQIGGMLNKTPMSQEEGVKYLATQIATRL